MASRFEPVRLRPGIATIEGHAFQIVETPRPVAVLTNDGQVLRDSEQETRIARGLLGDEIAVVAWIGPEAPGATVAHCYGSAPDDDVIDEAACAIWALKAIGGWDESTPMRFQLTQIDEPRRTAWVTVHATWDGAIWRVECARLPI